MKSILFLYFTRALNYSPNTATTVYHAFNCICYFMPIFGAMLADGYLGKFRTILYLSVVYSLGNLVMSLGAIPNGDNHMAWVTYIALVLIAIGTGGIKPCVSAFGADQFKPDQVRQKESFFSMFYMAINLGSLLSMIVTPILRTSVQCFDDDCYPLAFGIPACLMVISVVFFIVGSPFYIKSPAGNNVIGRLFGCVGTAIAGRCKKKGGPREHWLDYSEEKYGKDFVTDVKAVLRVLFMFIPLPVFWALFDQQGSRWIAQAGRMNGDLNGFVLQPDQMQVINPLLVVIMVPIVESLVFPCLNKLKIPNRPLQRLGMGLFLCSASFCIAGGIEIHINNTSPSAVPNGVTRVHFTNAAPCNVNYQLDSDGLIKNLPYLQSSKDDIKHEHAPKQISANFTGCGSPTNVNFFPANFTEEKGFTYIFSYHENEAKITQYVQNYTARYENGLAVARIINTVEHMTIRIDNDQETDFNLTTGESKIYELVHNTHTLKISRDYKDFEEIGKIVARAGAIYTVVIHKQNVSSDELISTTHEEIGPNNINIFLQLPQYIVMSFSEVLFSVTGLSFAYSQAPASMKAVLQAGWLLTNAVGNLIVVIVSGAGIPDQVAEYFFFAGLMFLTFIIFVIMSLFYIPVEEMAPVEDVDDEKKPPLDGEVNAGYVNDNALEKEKEAEYQNLESFPTEQPPLYEEIESGMVSSTAF